MGIKRAVYLLGPLNNMEIFDQMCIPWNELPGTD